MAGSSTKPTSLSRCHPTARATNMAAMAETAANARQTEGVSSAANSTISRPPVQNHHMIAKPCAMCVHVNRNLGDNLL